jgi:hypothetical protein
MSVHVDWLDMQWGILPGIELRIWGWRAEKILV